MTKKVIILGQGTNAKTLARQCATHGVISRFFKEMAEKHNVEVDDLNIHISYNQLYIQEYTPNQRNEFKCLEIVDLNVL